MQRSYRHVVLRVIRKLRLWYPHVLFSRRIRRVLSGAIRNAVMFNRAHLDVPQTRQLGTESPGRRAA
jgi:hypothetical protein